ncbi:MAG: hypothetical protein WCC00_13075 [Candidatus Aminicenantales bacterium]
MAEGVDTFLRQQLVDRRDRLERALSAGAAGLQVEKLIREVDAALDRMDAGSTASATSAMSPSRPNG